MKTSDWLADCETRERHASNLSDTVALTIEGFLHQGRTELPCLSGTKANESKIVWNSRLLANHSYSQDEFELPIHMAEQIPWQQWFSRRCIRTNLEVCLSEVSITLWKRGYLETYSQFPSWRKSKWFLNDENVWISNDKLNQISKQWLYNRFLQKCSQTQTYALGQDSDSMYYSAQRCMLIWWIPRGNQVPPQDTKAPYVSVRGHQN